MQIYDKRIFQLRLFNDSNYTMYIQIIDVKHSREQGQVILPPIHPEITIQMQTEEDDSKPHGQLWKWLLHYAFVHNYRRTEKAIYEEHIAHDKLINQHIKTNWYELKFKSYKELIQKTIKEGTPEGKALSNCGNPWRFLENALSHEDLRFPELDMKRTFFSFLNGIFDASTGKFHAFLKHPSNPEYIDHIDTLNLKESSCQFFDVNIPFKFFEPGFDLDEIKCPKFSKIFQDQQWSTDSIHFGEFLMGRLIKIDDKYGICWFLVGQASTGTRIIHLYILFTLYLKNLL